MRGGTTSHRAKALEFIRRFAAGDVEGLQPLLSNDLRLDGPYLHTESSAEYLEALRADPPEPSAVRVVSVTEDGDTVAVFYEYEKADGTVMIAQLFRFAGERIREIRLVFDGREST